MNKNSIKINGDWGRRFIILICAIMLAIASVPINTYADTKKEVVRVGYYENEIFQEGAQEGAVKTGYAYEYYRKLSEFTGWEYEYVYGEFGDLYQMLLDVDIASDGTEAVEKMKSASAGHYDIILMDIQMTQMDGYEATRQIRALDDKEKAGIPIVAVTANVFEEDKQIASDVGMNGHLAKPYDIPEIMRTLDELLN